MTVEQDEAEKQKPLFEDIRLLGQILGDTVREQEGEEIFERIEKIRRLSVAGKGKADSQAGRELEALLQSLSPAETASVIRAFAYFSHLANIAEDRHFLRRRAVYEPQTQPGGLAYSFERLRAAGVAPERIEQTLAESYVSPVLTAHPTEVQRRSTLDAERAIAELLAARETCRTQAELRENEAQLARAGGPALADAASCARRAFRCATRSTTRCFITARPSSATFRRFTPISNKGSGGRWRRSSAWATGSAATATAIRTSMRRRSKFRSRPMPRRSCAIICSRFTCSAANCRCRGCWSIARRNSTPWPRPRATAIRHRADETYRRALIGVYARLAGTLKALTGGVALRHAVGSGEPYRAPEEFRRDLVIVRDSLLAHHGAVLARGRLAELIRAVDVFGFHMATTDLRQNSDQHEAVLDGTAGGGAHRAGLFGPAMSATASRCCCGC